MIKINVWLLESRFIGDMARSLKKSVKLSLRHVRVRLKQDSSSIERDQRIEFLGRDKGVGEEENDGDSSSSEYEEFEEEEGGGGEGEGEEQDDGKSVVSGGKSECGETEAAVEAAEAEITEAGNRVMVVVDKVIASTGALEWALKHTLQSQDYLFLLYFSKPFRKGYFSIFRSEVFIWQFWFDFLRISICYRQKEEPEK